MLADAPTELWMKRVFPVFSVRCRLWPVWAPSKSTILWSANYVDLFEQLLVLTDMRNFFSVSLPLKSVTQPFWGLLPQCIHTRVYRCLQWHRPFVKIRLWLTWKAQKQKTNIIQNPLNISATVNTYRARKYVTNRIWGIAVKAVNSQFCPRVIWPRMVYAVMPAVKNKWNRKIDGNYHTQVELSWKAVTMAGQLKKREERQGVHVFVYSNKGRA